MLISTSEANSSHTSIRRGRFEFLDVARGIAALAVLLQHSAEIAFPSLRHFSESIFNFGMFGVTLFFLVSGFIIPISMERAGTLKAFWSRESFAFILSTGAPWRVPLFSLPTQRG